MKWRANHFLLLTVSVLGLAALHVLQMTRDQGFANNESTLEEIGTSFKSEAVQTVEMITAVQEEAFTKEVADDHEMEQLRCRLNLIGCTPLQEEKAGILNSVTEMELKNPSVNECAKHCWEEDLSYAMFAADERCFCGKFIEILLIIKKSPNLIFDFSECIQRSQADIYKIVTCSGVDDEESLSKSILGCFPTPLYFNETTLDLQSSMSSKQCLLACENEGYLLALSTNGKCSCINPTIRSGYPQSNNSVGNPLCSPPSPTFVRVMRTYVEDQRCPPKTFLPPRRAFVGLLSFQGSGNTWVRHLLEIASGYYTGSVYHDQRTYESGFIGEKLPTISSRVIATKSHCIFENSCNRKYTQSILLIRNPYDAFISEFNRKYGGGHVAIASEELFESEVWSHDVTFWLKLWMQIIRVLHQSDQDLHLVFYDDLLRNPSKEVEEMVKFIGVEVASLKQRLLCMQGDLKGVFHREKVRKDRFSPSQVRQVEATIAEAKEFLLSIYGNTDFAKIIDAKLSSYSREKSKYLKT